MNSFGKIEWHGDVAVLIVDPNRSPIGYCCKSAAVSPIQASITSAAANSQMKPERENNGVQAQFVRPTYPMYKLSTRLSFFPRCRGMSSACVPDASQAPEQP